jgi:hypothetical protein
VNIDYEPTEIQYTSSAIFNAVHSVDPRAALVIITEAARISKNCKEFDAAISAGIRLMESISIKKSIEKN